LFLTALLNTIVTKTNKCTQPFLQGHANSSPDSKAKRWKNVILGEIKVLITCLLNMNIIRRPINASHWYTSKSKCTAWFHDMFSRNSVQLIPKLFSLVDNRNLASPGEPSYDLCAKIQPLIDVANRIFQNHCIPHQQLSADESLI
jgi:hypothetical protein